MNVDRSFIKWTTTPNVTGSIRRAYVVIRGGDNFPDVLIGVCDRSLRNMTHFYKPKRVSFRAIFIILAKLGTQIYFLA